jgi:hypothetical protein
VSVNDHTDTRTLAIRLTRWFEARLDEMLPPRRSLARLYGLEVIDAAGLDDLSPTAVRMVFICEAGDQCALDAMPDSDAVAGFDAAATVEFCWSPPRAPVPRPGEFGGRIRERHIRVALHP